MGPTPHRWSLDVATIVAWLGLGISVGLTVVDETRGELRAPGGVLTFIGSATGMAGTYLALVMVLLASRIPVIERVLGQDGLLRWHRKLAPWPISLIAAHALLLTFAYADAAKTGPIHEFRTLLSAYPNMVTATIGLVIMVAIGIVSVRAIRRRLRREVWWLLHLSMYVALAVAFAHEIALGPSFVGHPMTRLFWSIAWASTAGVVLCYRVALPVVRTLRHRLRIVEVRQEAPGVVSVVCKGRNLERLAVSGGQFFEWRFLVRNMWWQAHPFTLSARPQPPYLRLTVKDSGDYSAAVAKLRPGVKVMIEGPYGAFTAHARQKPKVALIAGGIGVTAVRSLLEDLPPRSYPEVILRASSADQLVLADEVAELARHRKGRVHELLGPREGVDLEAVVDLVPDLAQRDVYVCGSEGFVAEMTSVLTLLGVPRAAIHYEAYSL